MNIRHRSLGVIALLAVSIPAFADTHYVSLNGLHQTPFTNWTMAATNFNDATLWAALAANDVLIMTNGTYPMTAARNIGINLTIRGAEGAAKTILDGGAVAHDGFTSYSARTVQVSRVTMSNFCGVPIFADSATFVLNDCRIEYNTNLTYTSSSGIAVGAAGFVYATNCVIRRNTGWGNTSASAVFHYGAGAICVLDGCEISENACMLMYNNAGAVRATTAGLTIRNSQIWGNSNAWTGGGIYIAAAGCLVENSLIVRNQNLSSYGGGAYIAAGSTIRNCLLAYNKTTASGGYFGGGAYIAAGAAMQNCLLSHNTSSYAGGAMIYGTMRNCTVVSNTAIEGGGIWGPGTSLNSIVYFNLAAVSSNYYVRDYDSLGVICSNSCTAPDPASYNKGSNCITANPKMVNLPVDCRLMNGSPCINTGLTQDWMTNAIDLDSRTRVREGIVDMGAYEWFPKGTVIMIQ